MHDGTRYYDVLIIVVRDDGDNDRDADETARENKDAIVQKLDLLGARNIAAAESLSFVTASIPVADIPGISLYDEVYAMGDGEIPVTLEIDTARGTVHATSNEIRTATGTNLDGRGVLVAIIDRGINHNIAFNDRIADRVECDDTCEPATAASVIGVNSTNALSPAFTSHGTHIAQVLAASGLPAHNGIAPGVELLDASITRHTVDDDNNRTFISANRNDVAHALDWSLKKGADIATTSFGFGICNGDYGNTTNLITNEAVDKGMVLVSSAGNRGMIYGAPREAVYQSITHPGCGHNEITVGGINDRGEIIKRADFSGRGPAPGTVLLKPEIVAPAHHLLTLDNVADADTFSPRSGTSLAAPQVSATAALMLQAKPDLTPVEIKTILLLGADWTGPVPCTSAQYEVNNTGDNCSHARQYYDDARRDHPAYLQILNNVGFGILNTAESLRYAQSESSSHIISDSLVSNTDTKQYWFTVQDTSKPVKVILSWLVHPDGSIAGQLSRTQMPVPIANLDFTITSPDNTTIRATSEHQTNEFAVFNPSRAGTYTITVSGSNIDNINKPVQDFALASTNPIMLTPPPPTTSTTISEDFGNLENWTQSGDSNWIIRTPSTAVPGSQSGNTVAYSSNCDRTCTITLSPVDLSSRQPGHLTFDRFVSSELDAGEYLKVELYDGSSWDMIFDWRPSTSDNDHKWHTESYKLSPEYQIDDLQVRITARSSAFSENIMIDNMSIQNSASTDNAVVFSDDFEDGTLNKWTSTNEPDWRADSFDEYRLPPDHPSSNKVAEADDCHSLCTITISEPINISNLKNPTLEFWRYVDRSLDSYDEHGEHLKVEVTTNGNTWRQLDFWTDENGDNDDAWHAEKYDLNAYRSDTFNVRFTASMSSSHEEVGIDDVIIKSTSSMPVPPPVPLDSDGDGVPDRSDNCPQTPGPVKLRGCPDTTPPVITVPDDIVSKIRAGIVKYIEFRVTAVDDADGTIVPSCNHDTGFFPIGITTVTCTARDAANNPSTASFTITIHPRSGTFNPDTDGDGYHDGIDNCPNEASATNRGCPEVPEPTGTIYYGGQQTTKQIEKRIGGIDIRDSTITIGATKTNGQVGFVTSGHQLEIEPNTTIDGYFIGEEKRRLATTNAEYHLNGIGDVGFVPITESDIQVSQDQIIKHDGAFVIVEQGTSASLSTGSKVNIYGIRNNGGGSVLYTDATIFDSGNGVLTNQVLTNYPSRNGDSGAPIIFVENNVNKLVGLHQGYTCFFDAIQPTHTTSFDIRDHPGLCRNNDDGDVGYFRVFTPWDDAKESLRLR